MAGTLTRPLPWRRQFKSNEPQTNLAVERRFFLAGPTLLAASFFLMRPKKALAAGPTFEDIANQIGQLALRS